jgi:hypothetical protein
LLLGYDQNEDEYTEKNASFVLGVPPTYQLTSPQQGPEHLTCKPVTELTNTEVVNIVPFLNINVFCNYFHDVAMVYYGHCLYKILSFSVDLFRYSSVASFSKI